MKVTLLTAAGCLVDEIWVLPMTPSPEVVFYGDRVFVRVGDDDEAETGIQYREGLLWAHHEKLSEGIRRLHESQTK